LIPLQGLTQEEKREEAEMHRMERRYDRDIDNAIVREGMLTCTQPR
jgi:hypothetical protein